MATTLVSIQEYLATSYEPDVDYVDGVLEDRNVGEWDHSVLQGNLIQALRSIKGLIVVPELRIQVAPTRFRIPDVAVYLESPGQQVPDVPPVLVVEVMSPEDRFSRILPKLDDYYAMGVESIWVLDPRTKTAYQYEHSSLKRVDNLSLTVRGYVLSLEPPFETSTLE